MDVFGHKVPLILQRASVYFSLQQSKAGPHLPHRGPVWGRQEPHSLMLSARWGAGDPKEAPTAGGKFTEQRPPRRTQDSWGKPAKLPGKSTEAHERNGPSGSAYTAPGWAGTARAYSGRTTGLMTACPFSLAGDQTLPSSTPALHLPSRSAGAGTCVAQSPF